MPYDFDPVWEKRAIARILPAIQLYAAVFGFGSTANIHMPAGLVPRDLDFLWPETKLFHNSHALFSAGAVMQREPHRLSLDIDHVVSRREILKTFILADSGGFQVANSGLGVTNDLRFLQQRWADRLRCNASPPVDVPSSACLKDTSVYFNDFRAALRTTVESLEFCERHRDPTSLVAAFNVFQGNTPQQAITWIKAVRRYGLRRVAWGGLMRKNKAHVLRRLLELDREGLLGELEHIHFLGVADLDFALLATSLQRALTEHLGHSVRVTFDVSTPYLYGYRDLKVIQPGVCWKSLRLNTRQLAAAGSTADADVPAPLTGSELGRLGLSMADLRRRGTRGPVGWDELGKLLVCNHNVEMMIRAIIEVNEQADIPDGLGSRIPHAIRTARDVIAETFTRPSPLNHVNHWASTLAVTAPASALTEEDR
jgi:hypothetical protein